MGVNFWIELIVGLAGLFFSVLAFLQARAARLAADLASKRVLGHSASSELSEIQSDLRRLDESSDYPTFRFVLTEANRKIVRLLSNSGHGADVQAAAESLIQAFGDAAIYLMTLQPSQSNQRFVKGAIYNPMEASLRELILGISRMQAVFDGKAVRSDANDEQA